MYRWVTLRSQAVLMSLLESPFPPGFLGLFSKTHHKFLVVLFVLGNNAFFLLSSQPASEVV